MSCCAKASIASVVTALLGNYRRSLFKGISNFSTYSNLTLVLLWVVKIVLICYIKTQSTKANKYFGQKIVKTYQALTDPVSRENYERYGHPDGRQGFEMGISLPHFLLDTKTNGGILLLGIGGVGILLPLVIASCCISLKQSNGHLPKGC